MNILTIDTEDWYNCDFISRDFDWGKFEVRIYEGVNRILDLLKDRNIKGTFFCLGWIAEHHPDIVKIIHEQGHQIGCHSYQHELAFRFDEKSFKEDTLKAKRMIEDVIGEEVNTYRAPGFSITKNNLWALQCLADMGFKYDCSVFPANHDYGGMPTYGEGIPKIVELNDGKIIKEFPITTHNIFGKHIVFSGGGFFRLMPYPLIDKWAKNSSYLMTYFHPRDFDVEQPVIKSLPLKRKFKSYVGIKGAFRKFERLLSDYDFINIKMADEVINWDKVPRLKIDSLRIN